MLSYVSICITKLFESAVKQCVFSIISKIGIEELHCLIVNNSPSQTITMRKNKHLKYVKLDAILNLMHEIEAVKDRCTVFTTYTLGLKEMFQNCLMEFLSTESLVSWTIGRLLNNRIIH